MNAFRVKVVDTTAAGDAFMGALAVALSENRPIHEALRFANGAGALAATKLGAQPSLPFRKEVEAFLSKIRIKSE
jgi:ribokinase